MRQFLRHYVTSANKRSGREGTLVKSPYKKSYFESKDEAKNHIKGLRNQILKKEQKLKKYRGRKKFYKITKRALKEHPLLCSKWKDLKDGLKNFRLKISMELSIVIEIEKLLLSKYLIKTLEKHLTFQ